MDDVKEEFEPLFDYSRIQPDNFVCLDDDSPDESSIFIPKKRKFIDAEEEKKVKNDMNVKNIEVVDCDGNEDDEEDWLPPPPKNLDHTSKILEEDSTLKALRLKRQELASFTESADELVRAVEESVRKNLQHESVIKNLNNSLQPTPERATKQPSNPPPERSKLVISIQDKDGLKQFRVYKDRDEIVITLLDMMVERRLRSLLRAEMGHVYNISTKTLFDGKLYTSLGSEEAVTTVSFCFEETFETWTSKDSRSIDWKLVDIVLQEIEDLRNGPMEVDVKLRHDDKFERLFKMYADKSKLDVKNLVFCFDGDKVSAAETPDSLGMEEDDIIEVHVKSS
ncbi:hypothetical protein OROGR_010298 [Orobanche gracilis]